MTPPADTSHLPAINSVSTYGDEAEGEATDAWLVHIAAGRIQVR
jgi:hypothetical protein